MINDKTEIKLNDKVYNARFDMKAIAETQYHFEKLNDFREVHILIGDAYKGNISIINEILVQSILRCHPQLTKEHIYENMKLKELKNILKGTYELLDLCLPKSEDDDKKKNLSPKLKKNKDWDFNYLEYLWVSVLKRDPDMFWSTTPRKLFAQLDAHRKYNGLDNQDNNKESQVVNSTEFM